MKHAITHTLRLDPGIGTAHTVQQVLLSPLSGSTQRVLEWHIAGDGMDEAASFIDGFGNRAHLVTQTRPQAALELTASGLVETHDHHGVIGRLTADPMPALYRRATDLAAPLPALVEKYREGAAHGTDRIGLLHALMAEVGAALVVSDLDEPGQDQVSDDGGQAQQQGPASAAEPAPADEDIARANRLAHAFIGTARALGVPARHVTGYLAQSRLGGARFHAWAEAYDDGLGWIGFDPSLNVCPTDLHIRLAAGLDAATTAPIRRHPVIGPIETLSLRISDAG